MDTILHRESEVLTGAQALTEAVARALFQPMSYKDADKVADMLRDSAPERRNIGALHQCGKIT